MSLKPDDDRLFQYPRDTEKEVNEAAQKIIDANKRMARIRQLRWTPGFLKRALIADTTESLQQSLQDLPQETRMMAATRARRSMQVRERHKR